MGVKTLIFIGMTVGSIIGGYVPTLWGADALSYSSLFGSGIGSLVGIYVGFKLSQF